MLRLLLSLLAFYLSPVEAHDPRPIVIEVMEFANGQIRLQMRLPPAIGRANVPTVSLSDNCQLIEDKTFLCLNPGLPENITLNFPDENPSLATMVILRTQQFEERHTYAGPGETQIELPLDGARDAVSLEYLQLGIDHILGAYDHILFVLCMVLLAGTWKRILLVVTGFTLAHSVTLGLAALGYIRIMIEPIEALIALSIVFVAAELARESSDSLSWRYPAIASSTFGLLHGLGFASAIQEIGLPKDHQLLSLLAFNFGVELGQILVVCVCLAIASVVTRLIPSTTHISRVPLSYGVGILASFWLFQRLTVL